VLWMLVSRELGYGGTPAVLLGLVVAGATGGYVRLADL